MIDDRQTQTDRVTMPPLWPTNALELFFLSLEESCTTDLSCMDDGGDRSRVPLERNLTVLDGSTGDLLLKLMHLANANRQHLGKPQVY